MYHIRLWFYFCSSTYLFLKEENKDIKLVIRYQMDESNLNVYLFFQHYIGFSDNDRLSLLKCIYVNEISNMHT